MIRFEAGDIVLVEFPFSHLSGQKRRPGLALLSQDADVLLARVTTQAPRSASDIPLLHWGAVGLPKASTVRLTKLATIDRRLIQRRVGRLHHQSAVADGIKHSLRTLQQAWWPERNIEFPDAPRTVHAVDTGSRFIGGGKMNSPTRREFSRGLLGAVGGVMFRGGEDKLKPSTFGGIQVGVQSYTFRAFSIDKMIEAMVPIGLSNVELWDGHLNPGKASEADFKAIKKKFDDAGIRVGAYCVNFPVDSKDDYLDRGFNGALLLGTRVMTASVKKPIVPRLSEWCQKYKIKLGLHNHWFGYKGYKGDKTQEFETPDDWANALKGASRYMSINLDIGHFYASGFDPVSFIREHHTRIVSLHIKDRDKDEDHTQRRFGQGATPIVETMKLLKKVKFKYVANIEYEPEEANPIEGTQTAFEYMKRAQS